MQSFDKLAYQIYVQSKFKSIKLLNVKYFTKIAVNQKYV